MIPIKYVVFKNNAPFVGCISKINGVFIDNAENLDVVMRMYNLIEYSKTYRKLTGCLWNYYRDEPNSGTEGNMNHSLKDSKSFEYKASTNKELENFNIKIRSKKVDFEIFVLLKHLSNFWRTLKIPLINYEIELVVTLSKKCLLINKAEINAAAATVLKTQNITAHEDMVINTNVVSKTGNPENAAFQITNTKFYVPVVTLSEKKGNILLEQLKSGFKRTVKWNRYRSQIIIQSNSNNSKC